MQDHPATVIYEYAPGIEATDDERRSWVATVQWAGMKARSNIMETYDGDPGRVHKELDPLLWDPEDPLNLLTVTEKMLEGDRIVSYSDVINVSCLISKSILTQAILAAHERGQA